MKHLLLTSLLLSQAYLLTAQTIVGPYKPGVTLDGITYCMPRTAVRLVITAEKTVYTPGELQRYSDRYMHLKDVKSEASTRWNIKDIKIEPYGVPDSTKFYTIALKQKTVAPYVTLARDGRLLAIHDDAKDHELAPVPSGKDAPAAADPRRYYTQDMLAAVSKAKLAELVAQEVYDIRDSRNALIRGEADNTPKDGAQLKLMLANLEEQEAALTSLFAGTTQTSTHVYAISCDNLTPDQPESMVARFSVHFGLVDKDDLSGEPLFVTVRQLEKLPDPVYDEAIERKKAKMTQGVYYNVPVRTEVSVRSVQTTYAKVEMPMAQFGNVEILSDALFNKNATTRVTFSGVTGGLVKIEEQ